MLKFQGKYQCLELTEGVQKCAKIWHWILPSVYFWKFRFHEKITEKLGYLVSFLLAKCDHRWRWSKFWTNATTTTPSVDGKLRFCLVFFWLCEQIFCELNLNKWYFTNFFITSAKIPFTRNRHHPSVISVANPKFVKSQNGQGYENLSKWPPQNRKTTQNLRSMPIPFVLPHVTPKETWPRRKPLTTTTLLLLLLLLQHNCLLQTQLAFSCRASRNCLT